MFTVSAGDAKQAKIGFTIRRLYQHQGCATEGIKGVLGYLFGELGLHRITAYCDVENPASAGLMERLGMRREGQFI